MGYKLYHIHAFTSSICKGNPACVAVLDQTMDDRQMLKIAARNGVPETAFILNTPKGYSLRWFTPDLEMDLCGHATLAAAFVAFKYLRKQDPKNPSFSLSDRVFFYTPEGVITVEQNNRGYTLDFPQRPAKPAVLPVEIYNSLNIKPKEVYLSRDYLLIYDKSEDIINLAVTDRNVFDMIDLGQGGVIVSSPGFGEYDFVSRFFTPRATILEDPVTGSAHCTLAPYWAERLKKTALHAAQLSENKGDLYCVLSEDRVFITGQAQDDI